MSLLKAIEKDYLTAYKAKEDVKVAVLRILKTAIKNACVELRREPDDDEVLDLIARQLKQRKESIEQFTKGGRPELAEQERLEMVVLQEYLPVQLGPEELERAVDAVVAETGASGMKDMGRVMQALLAKHKGQVDGKIASALVRARLAE
ncbi:MAG: GatB/YqeY domain-containing protein [Desulfovibrio sp.]